jgi:hypothetical protein
VYVITDGEDMKSPPPYLGPKGMNPLMKNLLSKNYRIEWTIIVVGMDKNDTAHSLYQDLCLATGGSFLSLNNGERSSYYRDKEDFQRQYESKKFLDNIAKAHGSDARAREKVAQENRDKFAKKLQGGSAEKFEWLDALPPPPHKK